MSDTQVNDRNNFNVIYFFDDLHYWASNFACFRVEYKGVIAWASEFHYMAEKFEDEVLKKKVYSMSCPHEAKKFAKAHKDKQKENWNEIKDSIMYNIVRAKLVQNPYIQEKLRLTGEVQIIEDSPYDNYWGRGPQGNGLNKLGLIWMKLRNQLVEGQLNKEIEDYKNI